jgi:hypothetical protein
MTMSENPFSVLAIGAHPDDLELQCAGTLARYVQQGARVSLARPVKKRPGFLAASCNPDGGKRPVAFSAAPSRHQITWVHRANTGRLGQRTIIGPDEQMPQPQPFAIMILFGALEYIPGVLAKL